MKNYSDRMNRSGHRTFLDIPDWSPARGGRATTTRKEYRMPDEPSDVSVVTQPQPSAVQAEELRQNPRAIPAPAQSVDVLSPSAGAASLSALPENITNPIFTPGYLQTQIGKGVHVEFYIGGNKSERTGILVQVGTDYLVLASPERGNHTVCDLNSVKFVTVLEGKNSRVE